MSDAPRRPVFIDLDEENEAATARPRRGPEVLDAPPPPEPTPAIALVEAIADRRRTGIRWGRLLAGALGGLVSLMIGVWAWQTIEALFARFDWLGWLTLGLAGLALIAGLALVLREVRATMRLREISSLRHRIAEKGETISLKQARRLVAEMEGLYAGRTDLAGARSTLARHRDEVMDGIDLLGIAENDLLGPLDFRATELVSAAARRTSVVTAVSPRALVDVAFVVFENARLISRVAALYGGRPGRLSFFGLARRTIEHLAVTTSIAIGDSIIQQALGHGITAKLSARLGEGVLNGLLTARVGLAAIDVCRPMPFRARRAPRIGDVTAGVVSVTAASRQTAG